MPLSGMRQFPLCPPNEKINNKKNQFCLWARQNIRLGNYNSVLYQLAVDEVCTAAFASAPLTSSSSVYDRARCEGGKWSAWNSKHLINNSEYTRDKQSYLIFIKNICNYLIKFFFLETIIIRGLS